MLPHVNNLREAVNLVIKNNKSEGYHPSLFIRITDCPDNELVEKCEKLIKSPSAQTHLLKVLEKHPNIITLEDFVIKYGKNYFYLN